MEEINPQSVVDPWIVKEVCCWLPTKILELLSILLPWYDFISDIFLAIKFKQNCHPSYMITSMVIMCLSVYVSMGLNTLFSSKPIWKRISSSLNSREEFIDFCKAILYGILFPIHLLYLSFKMLIYGNEVMTEQEKLHLFGIKFTEGLFESLPQLFLSYYVINHHGLEDPVQAASMLGSSLSLLYSYSMKQAYLKHSSYPTKKEIFLAGLKNVIPAYLYCYGMFVVMSWSGISASIYAIAHWEV